VLTTLHAVSAGNLLKPEDLSSREMQKSEMPVASLIDTPAARGNVVGSMIRHSMGAGEIILPGDIIRPGDHGFLAAVLAPGMRAVTVSVDAVSGTAGLIWPGDRVDLILLESRTDGTMPSGRRVGAETVLSNVRVIAIDQHLVQGAAPQGGDPGSRTATLEVSAEQAERVSVAAHIGKLSLTVRAVDSGVNSASAKPTSGSGVTWASDVAPALNPATDQADKVIVRVYQGSNNPGEEFKF
jgi:pilus assembly protein CpaB